MHNSVAFNSLAVCAAIAYVQFQNIFIIPKGDLVHIEQSLPIPSFPQSQATTDLLSILMDLPLPG